MGKYEYYFKRDISVFGNYFNKYVNNKILNIIFKYLKDGNRILEIGSGDGYLALTAKKKSIKYYCIEGNLSQCKKLKKDCVDIINSNVPPLPIDNNSIDVVLCSHVIEHISNEKDREYLMNEIRMILKNNGILIIIAPNYNKWKSEFWNVDYTHSYVTTPRRIEQMLYDNKYKMIEKVYLTGNITDWKRYIMNIIIKLYPENVFKFIFKMFDINNFIYNVKVSFLENFIIIAKKTD